MPRPATVQRRCLLLLDFLIVCACYITVCFYVIEAGAGTIMLWYEGGLVSIALVAGVIVATLRFQGLYVQLRIPSRVGLALQLITSMGTAFLSQALVQYAYHDAALPFEVMLCGSVPVPVALFIVRLLYFRLVARGFGPEPVLLVGLTPLTRELAEGLRNHPETGMAAAGFLTGQLPVGTQLAGVRVLGTLKDVIEICGEIHPDHVVADLRGDAGQIPPDLARRMLRAGITLERPQTLYETVFHRLAEVSVDPAAVVFADQVRPSAAAIAIQSVYNNIIGLGLLILLAPLMVFIALLIRVTSGSGPVRELKSMAGWDMIPFTLFRFRCTRVLRGGPGEDVEATEIGHWLQRLHLDRLPELINLLRGEIALVGPRPVPAAVAAEIMEHLPGYRYRFVVKPGFFGLSRNHVPPAVSLDEVTRELQYDLYYIKHMSIALDCSIVWQRLRLALRRSRRVRAASA